MHDRLNCSLLNIIHNVYFQFILVIFCFLYSTVQLFMLHAYGCASHAYLCTLLLANTTCLSMAYNRYIVQTVKCLLATIYYIFFLQENCYLTSIWTALAIFLKCLSIGFLDIILESFLIYGRNITQLQDNY